MRGISVIVKDKIAAPVGGVVYVCGNSDYVIDFTFDEEWEKYNTKTARFKHGDKFTDVVFDGVQCPVPIMENICGFSVGVFAGNLQTTTPAYIEAKKSILCGSGSPEDPTPDVYNQIMEKLNELSGGGGSGEVPGDVERTSNRVTVINETSDDEHYPTAKAVFNVVGDVEAALDGIIEMQRVYLSMGVAE